MGDAGTSAKKPVCRLPDPVLDGSGMAPKSRRLGSFCVVVGKEADENDVGAAG
jgi:hypothetical protein